VYDLPEDIDGPQLDVLSRIRAAIAMSRDVKRFPAK
jgi:hypothetical protein